MIVLLFMFCGFIGGVIGLFIGGIWFGAAALFGFTPPTPDQFSGLVLMLACGGALGSAALAGVIVLWDGA